MPGPLRDVLQRFDADGSGYIAEIQRMISANRDVIASIGEVKAAIDSIEGKSVKIDVDTAGALGDIAKVKAELDGLGDKNVKVSADLGTILGDVAKAKAALDGLNDKRVRVSVTGTAAMDRATDAAVRLTDQHNALAAAINASSTAAAAAAWSGGRGGGGGGIIPVPAGGGGGWGAAAAGAAAGAAGGRGGGGGGGGGFNPLAGGVAQFFTAARFWGMMSAEVLSTVIPAAVAAGSAAIVGMQGGQQLAFRYQAIANTAESIGRGLGMTTGSYIVGGPGGGALQNAQNQATGGVYELAGAGIRMLQGGAGQGFLQTGVNTIAMLDRSVANISPNLGQRIAAMLGGGTGYLQQFGQVGANLGNTLLNVAPNLPGVGADLLGALKGGTGLLATATRDIPGPLMGGLLAYEAASRWGPALLGGQGLIGRMLGLRGVGGIGGLLGKAGEGISGLGASGGLLDTLGLGIAGIGDAAAAAGGPLLGGAGLLGYLMYSGFTAKNLPAQRMADAQAAIGQGGFTGAWQPLGAAVTQMGQFAGITGATAGQPGALGLPANISSDPTGAYRTSVVRGQGAQYATAQQQFAQQLGDLANAGPQLVSSLLGLKDASGKAIFKTMSMADAFQIAQNAGLDIAHSFGPGGKLNQQAVDMMHSYVAAIGPMTQGGGAFGAAVSAQYIMGQPAMKTLSQTNQALDSMTQIMTAGPLGAAGLVGALGSMQTLGATLQLPAAPVSAKVTAANTRAVAQALSNVLTPGGASAWQAFAGAPGGVPGVVQSEQANLDQLRTALTLGGISQPAARGLAAYQMQQNLPYGRQSPAALAAIMQQGAQMGVGGYYDPSKTLAQNYTAAAAAAKQFADSAGKANADTQSMGVNLSRLPTVAKQFATNLGPSLQAAQLADASQQLVNINKAAAGGKVAGGAVQGLIADFKGAGIPLGAAMKTAVDSALKQAGVSGAMIAKINVQVFGSDAVSKLKADMAALHDKIVKATATADSGQVDKMKSALASLQNKTVTAEAVALGRPAILALGNAIAAIQSKMVTVTTVVQTIYTSSGYAGTIPAGAGNAAVAPAGGGNAYSRIHAQTGGLVPGSGSGDHVPFLLEPGEAVVPRRLVGLIAPILKAHHVPGFQSGGIVPGGSAITVMYEGGNPNQLPGGGLPIPAAAQKVLDQLLAELSKSGAWKQAGVSIINGITYSLSGTGKDANKVGAALVQQAASAAAGLGHKIQAEMNLARNVAGAALAGQGYGTTGLISGMDVTPGTGGGTLLEQMQSYLGSEKSFTGDLATLRKQHLSKALIAQMVAAGPVQGDALAQSVLNDYGGVKAVNATWNQIGQQSKGLGAQAAMAQYGGMIAPNLKSGTFTSNNVTVNVSVPGGAGGDLPLTQAQINTIVKEIQAKLLEQAKRNRRTGVKLNGTSA